MPITAMGVSFVPMKKCLISFLVFLFFLGSHCPPVFGANDPMSQRMSSSDQAMDEMSGQGMAMLCCGRSTPWENERPKELSLLPSSPTLRQTIPALPLWLSSVMLRDLNLAARKPLVFKTSPLLIASAETSLVGIVIKRQ